MLQSIRSVLAAPHAYQFWSLAVGGHTCSRTLVDNYIRPRVGVRILDIGCGPGTILNYLPQCDYLGFDLSRRYIELAKSYHPHAKFVCERVSQFALSDHGSFDLVLALGVVHHLDDTEALQLFRIAHDALRPGARLVTVDGVFTDDQSAAARWLLARDRGEYVRSKGEYLAIASQVFSSVTPSVRHDLLRIPYSHLILECAQ